MHEPDIGASRDRVALAVSAAESHNRDTWQRRFRAILQDGCFVPSRQILYAAGAHPEATLANCLAVLPPVDSLQGSWDALQDSVISAQAGADVGVDLSSIYPAQWPGFAPELRPPGPDAFAHLWRVARAMLGNGNGNGNGSGNGIGHSGAVVLALRCDHPDIEAFIEAVSTHSLGPQVQGQVLVTDAFMEAVAQQAEWPLLFPLHGQALSPGDTVFERIWPGSAVPQPCRVHARLPAKALWVRLLQAQCAHGGPRLVFADTQQRHNSLWYAEQLDVSSPSGHVPLSRDASCVCGHINLARCLRNAQAAPATVDWHRLRYTVAVAVRFLDNVHGLSPYPHARLARHALAHRRLGLGITGLASLLQRLGLAYASASAQELARQTMATVRDTAFQMSLELAREKGAFSACDRLRHSAAPLVLELPHALQDGIAQHGLRNSHLLAVGPDMALALGDPVSHGADPLPAAQDPPGQDADLAQAQLQMVAVLQSCVDNAVSVTLRVPPQCQAVTLDRLLRQAWALRLKNCLVLRSG